MSIVKVIEVIASSEKSIEDALQQAVAEASKTVRNIDSVYVKDIKAHVTDGKISSYGVISKISFRLDAEEAADPEANAEKKAAPQEQKAETTGPTTENKSVIQGKPGKETARGEERSAAAPKEEKPAKEAGKEAEPKEAAPVAQTEEKPSGETKQEPQAQQKQQVDTAGKQPDDRVEGEEEISEPENQKDFIPAH